MVKRKLYEKNVIRYVGMIWINDNVEIQSHMDRDLFLYNLKIKFSII